MNKWGSQNKEGSNEFAEEQQRAKQRGDLSLWWGVIAGPAHIFVSLARPFNAHKETQA